MGLWKQILRNLCIHGDQIGIVIGGTDIVSHVNWILWKIVFLWFLLVRINVT